MLKELLSQTDHSGGSDCSRSCAAPMAGVEVLEFDCQVPPSAAPVGKPGHFEMLLCRKGRLQAELKGGGSLSVRSRDILLLSDPAQVESFRFLRERVRGVLVAVEGRAARGSLDALCALLGITLDTGQVREIMGAHRGCALIRGTAWGDAVFSALEKLSPGERGSYCALKAAELLYLLCCRSPLLTGAVPSVYCDPRQSEAARAAHDYMMTHLDEQMTIQVLSSRFHISPTALKSCFRRLYGKPLHQYLLAARMRRAEELLTTTSLSILQVAGMVGYGSTSQFGAAFRRFCHTTPSQYRRQKKV